MIVNLPSTKEVEKINCVKEIQTFASGFKGASRDNKLLGIRRKRDRLD
jgi:hypothetical protein